MERRTGEPRCGKPDGSGCTDAKFLLGRTAEKRKGCISQPEWAGRSLGSLSSAGWQRETSRNSLAGHRQRREKKRVHLPAGRGGKEPRKPQLCRMAEGNFSELFGRTQAKKGNFGFLASERQKENFRVTFPGEARRWRKEILSAETVPGVVDIYIHTIHSYAF